MKYYRFRIKTTTEAEDVIISAMQSLGLEGAQIEDHVPLSAAEKEQQYIYEGAEPDEVLPDDGVAFLSFYVEGGTLLEIAGASLAATCKPDETSSATAAIDRFLDRMRGVLADVGAFITIGEGTISVDVMDDADWLDNWKQFFHKFFVDDVLVLPSWEEAEEEEAKEASYILRIDPGTAFGTGAHETTQLCIRALRKYLKKGDTVLDVGTGSGVLSILALMFGASKAVGTDLDPQVDTAVRDNLTRNRIPEERFQLVMGNLIDDEAVQQIVAAGATRYDIVLANILPAVLVPLTPVIPRFLKEGGYYITSGILTERLEEVCSAMKAAGLEIVETASQGEWNSIVAKK